MLVEDPRGIPNNLMPYITQVAVGRLPELNVYGHDYPTPDGSAIICLPIRDYIHVMDLADGDVVALEKFLQRNDIGCVAYNLGTGRGTSVLEMVAAFEKATGKKLPIKLCPRRPGDATAVYASTDKAERELGWKKDLAVGEELNLSRERVEKSAVEKATEKAPGEQPAEEIERPRWRCQKRRRRTISYRRMIQGSSHPEGEDRGRRQI
ncbi:hypothetical protein SASPL_133358 [Salvia splendens]|uniref:UDP-glucose 4-epimerase n=1 Tax=Salvia splendens TaxID=180675 RepID=A0A8X8ZJ14_SALSN|nr:hypothetical protein SASPL_133358 [Salvia splendens]